MRIDTAAGLYYPFIHFDDSWLKLAALYWDRVGRIVPEDYPMRDSPTVEALQAPGDFIWNEAPGEEVKTIGKTFLSFVDARQDALRNRYNINKSQEWPYALRTPKNNEWRNPRLAYIYNPKLWADLTGTLHILGLAESQWDSRGHEWIGMHPNLVKVYMSALAAEMARERHYSPVTDDSGSHLAAGGWDMEQLSTVLLDDRPQPKRGRTAQEVEDGIAHISLRAVVPSRLDNVPIEKIIEARTELLSERLEFQRRLRDIAENALWLQGITNQKAYERQLGLVYEDYIKVHVDQLEKDMRILGIPARRGIVSILAKAPKFAVDLGKTVGWAIHPAVGVGSSIAAIILPKFAPKAKERSKESQQVAYLLSLRTRFTPSGLAGGMLAHAERATAQALSAAGEQVK